MSDIFDDIELSATFNQEQLISELFKRNLVQQAEIKTLSVMVCKLFQDANGLTEDQAAEIMAKMVKEYQEEIFVNSEFLAEAWREKNRKDLGGMPGISFTD